MLQACSHFVATLRILRAPIAAVFILTLLLTLPDQISELFRISAQDLISDKLRLHDEIELVFSVVGTLLLALCIWCSSILLIAHRNVPAGHPAISYVYSFPMALSSVFFLSVLAGILAARAELPEEYKSAFFAAVSGAFREDDPEIVADIASNLYSFNNLLLVAVAVVALMGTLFIYFIHAVGGGTSQRTALSPRVTRKIWTALAIVHSFICIIVLLSPIRFPQLAGPFFLLFTSFGLFLLITSAVTLFSDRYNIPFLTLMVLLCIGLSLADFRDNHSLYRTDYDTHPKVTEPLRPLGTANGVFKAWWEARNKRGRRPAPYPVFVVAAQGGGIYAAFHTATFLSRIQDKYPSFAEHLFAISGVSGGSVGAAVFAALLSRANEGKLSLASGGANSPASFEQATESVLAEDYLSPLLAGLLFAEPMQQLLPYRAKALDRTARIETALELAIEKVVPIRKDGSGWTQVAAPNLLASAYESHWSPERDVPALVFNTTEVGSGRRRIITPFAFFSTDARFLPLSAEQPAEGVVALPVSVAAFASARFPWITPAAYLRDKAEGPDRAEDRKVRIVDGGYFENSGVATALEILRDLETTANELGIARDVQFFLLSLTGGNYPEQRFYGLAELLSPVVTMLSTRTARGNISVAQAERELAKRDNDDSNFPTIFQRISLKNLGYTLPLGWRLSTVSGILIKAQAGYADRCDIHKDSDKQFEADCFLKNLPLH
jgi:hypothetical protein